MIKLNITKDYSNIPTEFKPDDTFCYVATENDQYIGHAIFSVLKKNVYLNEIKTNEQGFGMIDGLARSAIFSKREVCDNVVFCGGDEGVLRAAKAFKAEIDQPFLLEKIFESCC